MQNKMIDHKAVLKRRAARPTKTKSKKVSSNYMNIIVSAEQYKALERNPSGGLFINVLSSGNVKSNLTKPHTGAVVLVLK